MKFSNHTWLLEATPSFFCSTIKDGCYLVIKMWVLKSKPRIPQAHHHSSRQYKEALEPACVFAVFCRIHEWGKGGNDDCLSIFVPISLALLLHRKSLWQRTDKLIFCMLCDSNDSEIEQNTKGKRHFPFYLICESCKNPQDCTLVQKPLYITLRNGLLWLYSVYFWSNVKTHNLRIIAASQNKLKNHYRNYFNESLRNKGVFQSKLGWVLVATFLG